MTTATVALAGSPNCGKTALFNALTGSHQKTGNYAGVTVEKKEGFAEAPGGLRIRWVDLPGVYSLQPTSLDEEVTLGVLLGKFSGESMPDLVVAVADATNLERHLGLVLELRELGQPIVLALNMMDLAEKRGLRLDLGVLSRELGGVPVAPTVAVRKKGVRELLSLVEKSVRVGDESASIRVSEGAGRAFSPESIQSRFDEVDRILRVATQRRSGPDLWTERLDRVVLHSFWGAVVLLSLLLLVFQAVFSWAAPLQDAIEGFFTWMSGGVGLLIPDGPLRDLLLNGVIAGVGSVIIFLPQILILFFFILLLEDSGYMARAAFLMDRLMRKAGLHGRALIPLLSSVACAVPGIMATRTIPDRRDRLVTILVSPLMTCSARLPVYSLLIAAFIPYRQVGGIFNSQGLVLFGLYLAGTLSVIAVATFFKKTLFRSTDSPLIMELPGYKVPSLRSLLMGLWARALIFLKRAGTVIFALSILVWFLASYPKAPEGASEPTISYSYAARIGGWIEPVMRPLGFDWRISTSLIPGFAAREVMVGALATVYAVEQADEAETEKALGERLQESWPLATALALMVWYIFAPQCLSTIAVVRRETNSWRWPAFVLVYMTALAYLGALLTYQVTTWLL